MGAQMAKKVSTYLQTGVSNIDLSNLFNFVTLGAAEGISATKEADHLDNGKIKKKRHRGRRNSKFMNFLLIGALPQ